ncbi:MAG: YkgJ family cysteine cluster protein [Rhodospirillales bacterium]|nr:YkgJ family cysteine cluster protein [Rhodospirillales bacterium]
MDQQTEAEILGAARNRNDGDAVTPVRLGLDDRFQFSCHPGVSCWNKCCHGSDITLTPADILRLSAHFTMTPAEFLAAYTFPAINERSGLPVAKLNMDDGDGACPFVAEEGCTVYANRPLTCRYYPIGSASVKMKEDDSRNDFNFLVKESFCCGHDADKSQTIGEFRAEQGVEDYDRINRGWIDILMKMASWKTLGGPQGKDISKQTKQMFFMVSTDVETFRRFVFASKFTDTYEVDAQTLEAVKTDDVALLGLGFDWMKNVLFNDPALRMKEDIVQKAVAGTREEMGAM